jgi:hypothetical protein
MGEDNPPTTIDNSTTQVSVTQGWKDTRKLAIGTTTLAIANSGTGTTINTHHLTGITIIKMAGTMRERKTIVGETLGTMTIITDT